MPATLKLSATRTASIITFSVTILLALFAFYVEFFYSKAQISSKKELLNSPIPQDVFSRVSTVKIQNQLGEFLLKQQDGQWLLEEPKKLPANSRIVSNILDTVKKMEIRTIHAKDIINIQSFSLNTPMAQITLYTKLEESFHLKFGLVNPVTKTTYLDVSGRDQIFEMVSFRNPIEQIELTDLIDSRVFAADLNEIRKFTLTTYNNTEPRNILERVENSWASKRYKVINNKNVESTIGKILRISPHFIVDQESDEIKTYISNYTQNPLYTIRLYLKNKQVQTYRVSRVVRALKELKIKSGEYFIISSSTRRHPFIVKKKFLDLFQIRYEHLK